MKRNVFGALMTLIIAFTIATPAVHAQSTSKMLKAEVPFAFAVESKQMPAGAYEVSRVGGATLIESTDHHNQVFAIYWNAGPATSNQTKLVFDRIGDHYFLRQIWSRNSGEGLQVPTSKLEKEMTASNRANGDGGAETVIVALR